MRSFVSTVNAKSGADIIDDGQCPAVLGFSASTLRNVPAQARRVKRKKPFLKVDSRWENSMHVGVTFPKEEQPAK
jgi:hypothetical protein